MRVDDLRKKSKEELDAVLRSLYSEKFRLRLQKATGQIKQTHLIGQVRKDIARVLTVSGQGRG
jgi:large subunit ribosomal protein L29